MVTAVRMATGLDAGIWSGMRRAVRWMALSALFCLGVALVIVYAHFANFGEWLETRPPSMWLSLVPLAFFLGFSLASIWVYLAYTRQVRHIYQASGLTRKAIDHLAASVLSTESGVAAWAIQANAIQTKELAELKTYTKEILGILVRDGECTCCGSKSSYLMGGHKFSPMAHSTLSRGNAVKMCLVPRVAAAINLSDSLTVGTDRGIM
jgi:hypothetical protein